MNARIAYPTLLATAALALAGCSATAGSGSDPSGAGSKDGALTVVASTSVYADIATKVAGSDAEVSAIITSGAQDPHEYESTAQDKLTVSKADLVIVNGGGYDGFMDSLEKDGVPVITAVDFAPDFPGAEDHDHEHEHTDEPSADEASADAHTEGAHAGHDHIEGFNEHVWYDPEIMAHLAEHIAEELGELDPDNAKGYTDRAEAFHSEAEKLIEKTDALKAAHPDTGVFITEPVALRLLERAGMHNETPAAFSEAVEEGQDVPPATVLESIDLLKSGRVALVVVNTQTGGAETEKVETEAETLKLPIVKAGETLPDGEDYFSWMSGVIDDLTAALS